MSRFYGVLERVWKFRYIIVLGVFGILLGFADDTSLWHIYQRNCELRELRTEVNAYKEAYEDYSRQLNLLETSYDEVERVARECHLMKRPGEDVFLIIEQPAE